MELNAIADAAPACPPLRTTQHFLLEIHGDDLAIRTDEARQSDREVTEATAKVENTVTRLHQVTKNLARFVDTSA